MALITTSAGPKFEEGTYEVAVVSLKPKQITEKATGQKSDVIEWKARLFWIEDGAEVVDEDTGEPIEASALSSMATGPKSKNTQWLVALLGPQAGEPGFEVEEDDPRVLAARGLGEIVKDDGGYAKIASLAAKPRSRATVRQQATAPAAEPTAPEAPSDDDDLPF